MITLYLEGIGLVAPGIGDWQKGSAILNGSCPYRVQDIAPFRSNLLPANERRRTTRVIKLILQVTEEMITSFGIEETRVTTVFASSEGDSEIIDQLCTALSLPGRPVSPTHFHNSVHNAPAGYWSIATECHLPSVSLAAHDASFSAGLLEAAAIVVVEQTPVLLVVYDYPPPMPLAECRPILAPVATALLLKPERGAHSLAKLTLTLDRRSVEDRIPEPDLERLRVSNPAARGLPLLRAIAIGHTGRVVLPYVDRQHLCIELEP